MPENDIKIYKLSYSGTFEEKKNDKPLKLFTLYSILAIYSKKAKKMYIWVGKNATHTLKLFIPQIRELFSQKYPKLRILRNITIESGEEPFEFFNLFNFDKNSFEGHIVAQEKIIEPINNEIEDLNEKVENFVKEGQYQEAIAASEKLLVLSKQINDKSLQKDQEELIETLKEKQGLKSIVIEIEKKALEIEKKFDILISQEKIEEAHEIVTNFKLEIKNNDLDLNSIPVVEKLILKDDNAWHAAHLKEEKIISELSILEKEIDSLLKKEDFSKCEKKINHAFEVLKSISDDSIKKKWSSLETKFKKHKSVYEKKQEELRILHEEMEQKAANIIKEYDVLLNQKKIVKAHEIISDFKLELKNKGVNKAGIPVAEKLFSKEEEAWKKAKQEEEQSKKQLIALEKDYNNFLKKEEFSKCEEIIQTAFELMDFILDDKIIKKWNSLKGDFIKQRLEYEEKQKKILQQISTLQKNIEKSLEKNFLSDVIEKCENLIKIAEDNDKPEIIKEYSSILEESKRELEETREIIETLNKEILILKEKGEYKKGISKINSMLEEIDGPDFLAQTKEIEKLKEELITQHENEIRINEELKVLEEKLNICQDDNLFKDGLKTCEKLINNCEEIGNEKLVKKYTKIREEIKKHRNETIEVIESLINDLTNLQEEGKFEEGMVKIDSIIEEIPLEEFPEENSRIIKLREELKTKHDAILNYTDQLNILEDELSYFQKEKNLHEALRVCEKIIQSSKKVNKDEIVEKYNKNIQKLKKEIEKKGNVIDSFINDISKLKEREKLEDIINKIDNLVEEIPEFIFSKKKDNLFKIKNEILDEIEKSNKILAQIKELEKNLSIRNKENDLEEALGICEEIIQIAKDNGKNEIIEKYEKSITELKGKLNKKRDNVERLVDEISDLKEKEKFDEIISKIDKMVEEIPELMFSKLRKELLKIKKEILKKIESSSKILTQIKELEEKIQVEFKNKNFDFAKKLCDEIIKISVNDNLLEIATKYTNFLKVINEEIESKKIFELKGSIEELSIKGIESLNSSLFQESMNYFEKIIYLLEKMK